MEAALAVLAVITLTAVVVAARSQRQAARAQRQLEHLERSDTLTDLPNREQLRLHLDRALHDAQRSSSRIAITAIELHRFAYLNETYGHEVGDALLVAASRALAAQVRTDELAARFGGPQFVVVTPGTPDPAVARQRAQQLLDGLQRSYAVGPDRIRITASAGVTVTDQQVASVDDVLVDVHVALQHALDAREAGSISVFDASMRTRFSPSAAEHRLREALDNDEFSLSYLPVVRLADRRVVGVEAVLGWQDRTTGTLSPRFFLRSLEETGLIVPVGAWAMRQVCRDVRAWTDALPGIEFDVSVNVTPRQLLQSDFVDSLREAIDDAGADPDKITVELTEGALLDPEGAWATLREVKALGVGLSLDNFGRGSSSLSYLRRFRLDNLKIAREFIAPLGTGREDEAIVRQLIELAHALDMHATAEGVDSVEQERVLVRLGCDAAQGDHLAGPQPPSNVLPLLETGRLETLELLVDPNADGAVLDDSDAG